MIVQATCHGADNRAVGDALQASEGRARGVATVREEVTDRGGPFDLGERTMKAVLAGAGAIGQQHLDAIQTIGGIEVVSLVVRDLEATRAAAGKHVQVEIPLADSSSGAEAVTRMPQRTGLVCMVDHTRRFNPSPQWVHQRIARGESKIQQLDVQAYFFRRTNMNALGQPRS